MLLSIRVRTQISFLISIILSLCAVSLSASAALLDSGRIAFSSDGNIHDPDDIVATAISVAMVAKAGKQNKLVYYGFSDHIWAPHDDFQWSVLESNLAKMRTAARGTAQEWGGFDMGVFYQAYDESKQASGGNYNSFGDKTKTAINALKDQINVSSSSNPLTIIMAGPAEVVWHAVNRSNSNKRQYVTVVSHSGWNDWHGNTEHGGHSYDDVINLGVNRQQIADQNNHDDSSKGLKQDPWRFHWMRDSGDSKMNSLWQRHVDSGLENCCGIFDGSDAGMTWYALFGESFHNKSANVLKNFFEQSTTPPPSDNGKLDGEHRLKDKWRGFNLHAKSKDAWTTVGMRTLNASWSSQKWEFEHLSGNTYRIKNVWSGLYLNASSTDEWSPIYQAPLNNDWGSMKWVLEKLSGDEYRVKNVWSNYYLSTQETEGYDILQAGLRNDWSSQKFTITKP